MANHCSKQR